METTLKHSIHKMTVIPVVLIFVSSTKDIIIRKIRFVSLQR